MNHEDNLTLESASGTTSGAGGLSRRDFLSLAGMTTATLALADNSLAEALAGRRTSQFPTAQLATTHDLISLPVWGPYSKKYFGISHIPDVLRGLSFDLSVFPLLSHGPVQLPSVTGQTGVHPWEASPTLEFYSLRLETIWKDQLYCDLSFSQLNSRSRLIRMEVVNRTAAPQELALNCLAQLCFPPVRELTAQPIQLCAVELPTGAIWVHALDYADLQFARPRPTDNLVPDGKWRGEDRCHYSVGGSVVAQGFGKDAGDTIHYRVILKQSIADAVLIWRFQLEGGESISFHLDGAARGELTFHGSGEFATASMPLGPLEAGNHELHFTSRGGAKPSLNGFVLVEAERARQLRFVKKSWHPSPEVEVVQPSGLLLKYQDVPNSYGLSLDTSWLSHRELKWRDLDAAFHTQADPNTLARIFGNGHGRAGDPDSLFICAESKPFTIAPNSKRLIYGLVCTGSEAEVRHALATFDPHSANNNHAYSAAKKTAFHAASTPAGEPFQLSQQLMAAVTMTNLVYPLYTQRNYIRHYSPGRIWDCLYTWDTGFVGLGLLEIDPQCAIDLLNTYTTPPGSQSAFIHHGSPVPTQIYLYRELWNRTQSRELLAYFYPRLRQYHRFLAGRLGSSTTRRHQDHLICTWDYFYNSGGWDDYPPQKFVHEKKLTNSAAPAVNSSHTIRCAKILRQAAEELGYSEDLREYDQDITELSHSLQSYSWDHDSGYYGYVMHDQAGKPTGILRTADGVNFNMGLDGVYPLVAGICSQDQEGRILEHLFSDQHLWMDIGITTVDKSAPYFNPNGYWNGSVWFAHQWFIWKTMFDMNRPELANRIAQAGLAIWKKVTDASYDCMEHFMPRPPYGAGWHQFSSLSSPVLSWFASLYTPGRLTCGFDTWIQECNFSHDNRQLEARLRSIASPTHLQTSILVCMHPDSRYHVRYDGRDISFSTLHDGLLQIPIPSTPVSGKLTISSV